MMLRGNDATTDLTSIRHLIICDGNVIPYKRKLSCTQKIINIVGFKTFEVKD